MKPIEYIKSYVFSSFREGTQISRFNIIAAAILGAPAHFLFYFLFKYIFQLPYENIFLRLTAVLLCLVTLFKLRDDNFLGKYFPVYWHMMLIFVLPFIFTAYLLKNNFHELWLYWEIFMIFILISFVPNWLMFLFDLAVGVFAAILFFVLTTPSLNLQPEFDIPLYTLVIFFTMVAGYVFSYSNRKGMLA